MTGPRPFARLLILFSAGVLLVVACGGSSPATQAGDTGSTSGSTSGSTADDSPQTTSGGGSFGDVPSDIATATYQHGSAHVEISGDKSASADWTEVAGNTINGLTFITYRDQEQSNSFTLSVSKPSESGVAITIDGITTGGDFVDLCKLSVSKNTAAEFSGTFVCDKVDAVDSTTAFSVSATGSFSAKP